MPRITHPEPAFIIHRAFFVAPATCDGPLRGFTLFQPRPPSRLARANSPSVAYTVRCAARHLVPRHSAAPLHGQIQIQFARRCRRRA
jgi:hypothetical protein